MISELPFACFKVSPSAKPFIIMEITIIHMQILVYLHVKKTPNFDMKVFLLRLTLKQRWKATLKSPITITIIPFHQSKDESHYEKGHVTIIIIIIIYPSFWTVGEREQNNKWLTLESFMSLTTHQISVYCYKLYWLLHRPIRNMAATK